MSAAPPNRVAYMEAIMAIDKSTRITHMRDRLSAKYSVCPHTGCWLWSGSLMKNGYGKIALGAPSRAKILAHRASYELYVGPIPAGVFVCHRCDIRSCVNPDHLFLGSPLDNMRDASIKGRLPRGESSNLSKLTINDVNFIREWCVVGRGGNAHIFANKLGVCITTIKRIANRETWRWAG